MVGCVDMPYLCSVYGRGCGHALPMQCMVGGVDMPYLCSVYGRGCGHALPMQCVW